MVVTEAVLGVSELLVAAGERGVITIRAVHSLVLVRTLEQTAGHGALRCLCFTPDGRYLHAPPAPLSAARLCASSRNSRHTPRFMRDELQEGLPRLPA